MTMSVDGECWARRGKRVNLGHGYLPCLVLTGKITKRQDVAVKFDNGTVRFFPASWVASSRIYKDQTNGN